MKILQSLNRKTILILFLSCFYYFYSNANEPVDIWNLDKLEKISDEESNDKKLINDNKILENSKNIKINNILLKQEELTSNPRLIGLYDPEEHNLQIDMWGRSDGDQIKSIMKRINKIKLSKDANNLLQIALLTNSYAPKKNITEDEFINYKINYLKNTKNFKLVEEFLKKNNSLTSNNILIKDHINNFILEGDLNKSCNLIKNFELKIDENYIEKFLIYCLIKDNKKEEAQLLFDLKKEANFNDNFFDKKFHYLMGYTDQGADIISENNILDFHLSHKTNKNFSYNTDENTKDFIWKYLSSYNLLEEVDSIDLDNQDKIITIEKATHEKNYKEQDLLKIYKRFQFSIDQLINIQESYKLLPNYKSRAILYQRILLTYDTEEKIKMIYKLKNLMIKDKISNAFDVELVKLLKNLKSDEIPSNYTSFYKNYIVVEDKRKNKIKFNNKIIHQSKLINYFVKNYEIEKVSKDTNDILKKIKSNKEYVFSNKDKMILDSIIYDGAQLKKNYLELYEQNPNIPIDLQVLINDKDIGMILLRLVEIIGEDSYEELGTETLYFITSILNQIDLDKIRNSILLEILPFRA